MLPSLISLACSSEEIVRIKIKFCIYRLKGIYRFKCQLNPPSRVIWRVIVGSKYRVMSFRLIRHLLDVSNAIICRHVEGHSKFVKLSDTNGGDHDLSLQKAGWLKVVPK